jgi:Sulfotransferase family
VIVRVERAGLAYYPVPKAACTSLKLMFFELNEGQPFKAWKKATGYAGGIHVFFNIRGRPKPDATGLTGLVVLRDPFARALSTYFDKVARGVFQPKLVAAGFDFAAAGLDPRPGVGSFLANLAQYLKASPLLRRHASAVRQCCPHPLHSARHVIRLEDAGALEAFVARLGLGMTLPRRNVSKRPDRPKFTRAEFASALEVLAPDYAFLRRWYVPPAYPG